MDRANCRAERVQHEWDTLAARAKKVHDHLPKDTQPAFYQLVYMLCEMQANINRLYIAGEHSPLSVCSLATAYPRSWPVQPLRAAVA